MRVLITRPRLQAESFAQDLAEAGFEPVFFPVIEIRPFEQNLALEQAIQNLSRYDWLIFTSLNGVQVFFETMQRVTGDAVVQPRFEQLRTAAIGPKTAEAMQQYGITPDFVPQEFVAEAILPGLGDLVGRWVLLPRAETARKALPEAIIAAGGVAHEIAVYQTLPALPDPQGLATLKAGVEVVTFTSPSTVENFIAILRDEGLDPLHLVGNPKIACIGPITKQAALSMGYTELLVAENYTTAGLVKLLHQVIQEEE